MELPHSLVERLELRPLPVEVERFDFRLELWLQAADSKTSRATLQVLVTAYQDGQERRAGVIGVAAVDQ